SIGAITSSASAQPSASASGRVSAGTGRGNKAASKRSSASSRDRIVRNCSCSLLSRSFAEGVLVIPELISVPQHIGIDRAACRKSFRGAWYYKPGFSAGDRLQRQFAQRQRGPHILLPFQQHDFGDA